MPLPIPDPALKPIDRLAEIMALLRGPGGCPWDREQTHATIRMNLIEECYEVVDAIDANDLAGLREELGDLLLHVVFHAQLAAERGDFTLNDVAKEIVEKLIRRHPHVFGDHDARDSNAVLRNWDALKKKEKPERESLLDGVPRALPALLRAEQMQKKAAKVGFDWENAAGPREKINEELAEIEQEIAAGVTGERLEDEVGDLFFSVVCYARHLRINPEAALNRATAKFQTRFQAIEAAARAQNREMKDLTFDEMEVLWQAQKKKS